MYSIEIDYTHGDSFHSERCDHDLEYKWTLDVASEKLTISKNAIEVALKLAQSIAVNVSDERSAKFGYDMMKGIISGNYIKRLNAWIDWYNNYMEGDQDSVDEERDGIWVPAIPYSPE